MPLAQRATLGSLAFAIGIPKTSLGRLLKTGNNVRHSSSLKPILTEENKQTCIKFRESLVQQNSLLMHMMQHVHVDEKWFYTTKLKENYYLLPDESTIHTMNGFNIV